MSREEALAKLGRLRAVTIDRGATPAEAATAASMAERLTRQIEHRGDPVITSRPRRSALAPGVHVTIV
jgi:hypothetical protein